MPGKMSKEEVDAFLDSKPGWMMLTSQGRDGYPHTVPIGYFRDGDRIFMGCRDNTQKVKNIERNPKVSLMIEDGKTMSNLRGILFRGDASVVREDEERLKISRLAAKLRGAQIRDLRNETAAEVNEEAKLDVNDIDDIKHVVETHSVGTDEVKVVTY